MSSTVITAQCIVGESEGHAFGPWDWAENTTYPEFIGVAIVIPPLTVVHLIGSGSSKIPSVATAAFVYMRATSKIHVDITGVDPTTSSPSFAKAFLMSSCVVANIRVLNPLTVAATIFVVLGGE